MPRLLLVAFFFPPSGGGGSQRPAKFAKYLPEFDWDVCAVVPKCNAVQGQWAPNDESLCADIGDARVERVASGGDARRWRPVVDSYQDWADAAFNRIERLIAAESIDAVMITMSPFSLAHIGIEIKKRYDLPVILDLRDPWALDGWPVYRHWFAWRRDMKMLRQAIHTVDGVIANTPESLRALREVLPEVPEERWLALPNGYDQEDFERVIASNDDSEHTTIVHAGSLHSSWLYAPRGVAAKIKSCIKYRPEPILPEGRTLMYLLRALRQLREAGHRGAERVRIQCVGTNSAATERCVMESGLSNDVEITGYVSHDASLQAVLSADALFLPLHGYLDRNRRSLIVPGKTYEYLASGKPILGCLPAGDARDLVEQSGRGYLAYPTDQVEIREALARLIDDAQGNRVPSGPIAKWVRTYERKLLTGRLAEFLESVRESANSRKDKADRS